MDKDSILDLLALIRAESVSLAANSRNTSQSAFSRRLQALEYQFGAELVDRSRRPSGPTYQLRTMQGDLEAALASLNRLADGFSIKTAEPLRVAALHSISANILPRALARLGDVLRERDIRLRSANHEVCFQMLMTEEVLVAFIYETEARKLDPPKDLVHRVSLGFEPFVPVASPRYLDKLQSLIDRGETLPLISYPSEMFMGDLTRASLLPKTPHRVSLRIVSGLTQAVTKCIEQGLGMGWLPRHSISDQLALGTLVRIDEMGFPASSVELSMMRLKTRNFAPHEELVDAVCAEMASLLQS